MTKKSRGFVAVDVLLLSLALLPLVCGMVLKVLTTPSSADIDISGSLIYFTIPMPFQDLPITESQVNSALVSLTILFLCLYLTHGIAAKPTTKRQLLAAIMGLSAFSSLLTLIGLTAPTADLNVVGGWALLVFFLITYYKCKCGPLHYLKSFCEPAILTPLNVISEVATPISMAFRHYGNVLSGAVISVLIGAGLQGLSKTLLGWLPGVLGDIPLLQIGLPAVLSLYFDIFSGLLQAFIFAMLTMLYVSGGFPADDYAARKRKKAERKQRAAAADAEK